MPQLTRESQMQPAGAPPADALLGLLYADERPARAELRRQVARLELELSQLFASAFPRRGIGYEVTAAGGPRLLGIEELEELRDRLLARVAEVRRVLARHGDLEARNRELLERVLAEPERYRWVRISNEEIGEPGCRVYHSRPRFGLLGMLMGWWRVKVSSGCPLGGGCKPAHIGVLGRPPRSRTI